MKRTTVPRVFSVFFAIVVMWGLSHTADGKLRQRVVRLGEITLHLERYGDNHPEPIKMGIDSNCDDGKTNLTLDWPDPGTLLCSSRNSKYPLYGKLQNKKECINLPANYHDHYSPDHYCMYTEVTYDHVIPVIEGHRPVWPIFGEYYHVPRQRYLHSIEHGSVVMLYHPCTAEHLVARLRSLVTRCVRKYVISREPLLDPNYPIALAAWGCRLQMNSVNDTEVIEFIKTYALHGPEKLYEREGQYNYTLFRTAFYPPGMLENPSKPAQGQKMTVCPAQSLEGHFQKRGKANKYSEEQQHIRITGGLWKYGDKTSSSTSSDR